MSQHGRLSLSPSQPQIITLCRPRINQATLLRVNYFGAAAESAARYHIHFDRILQHLWQARTANPHSRLKHVECIDDLVHAIACIDDIGLAWADLAERYEQALVRRCRANRAQVESIIAVRRMFAQLRQRNRQTTRSSLPSLRCYWGDRPLRVWLSDRLSAALTRDAITALREESNRAAPRRKQRLLCDESAGPLQFRRLPGSLAG